MQRDEFAADTSSNAEAHVWLIDLVGPDTAVLARHLSQEESARAARFVFARDRSRFTIAHVALRDILARYTGAPPLSITIETAEKGKPYLPGYTDIRFNLSHSGTWALAAIARGREVGVDIEQIRADRSTEDIAERFFAPAEVQELMVTPPEDQVSAFFACWSRKEAYIKARGGGLAIPLDSFEVSLGRQALLRKAEDRERWSMHSLQTPAGYAAALVAEGNGVNVKQIDWPGLPET